MQTLLLSGQGIWLSPASRGSVSTREHMSCSPGGEACRHPTREKIQGCTVPPLPVDKDSGLVSFQVSRMKQALIIVVIKLMKTHLSAALT